MKKAFWWFVLLGNAGGCAMVVHGTREPSWMLAVNVIGVAFPWGELIKGSKVVK